MSLRQTLQRWIWPQRGERLKAVLVYGVAACVVAMAVALTGIRLAFAFAPALVERVEAVASGHLGADLSIGELDARLAGWRPSLVLSDVVIRHVDDEDQGQPLRLQSLSLVISPWASLQQRRFQLHSLEASGLEVAARRQADQTWRLAGLLPLPVQQRGVSLERFIDVLRDLPVDHLLIRDSRLLAQDDPLGVQMSFDPVALRWRQTPAGEWRFAVDARAGEQRMRGRLRVPAGDPAATRGFIDLSGIHGHALPRLPGPAALRPDPDARLDARLWLDFPESGLPRWQMHLQGEGLNLLDGSLDQMDAVGQWHRTPEGWQGGLHPRQLLDREARPQSVGDLALGQAAGSPWRLKVEALPLAWLAPLAPELQRGDFAVAGHVQDLAVVWESPSHWRARGDVRDAELLLRGQGLTASGEQLSVELGPRGGELTLQAGAAQVGDGFLREGVSVTALSGGLAWWQAGNGEWRGSLTDTEGVVGGAPFRLSGGLWAAAGQSPFVDLQASLGGLDADRVLAHLPESVMPPAAVQWLDEAIVGGRVAAVSGRLAGPLDAFPFDEKPGVFDLKARVEDVELAFWPDWPSLEHLVGTLRFRNRSMGVEAESGVINGVRVDSASASVDDLQAAVVEVNGRMNGPLTAMVDTLLRSPLADPAGPLSTLSTRGEGQLNLSLKLPLDGREPDVDGILSLAGAEVASRQPAGTLSEIHGEIGFNRDGVHWDGLRARLQGRDLIAQARTRGEGASAGIRIDATSVRGLDDWPGMALLSPYAHGESRWRLRWEQPGFAGLDRGQPVPGALTLRTDLSGVGIEAPLGLSKSAEERVDLQFAWERTADGQVERAIRYGDRLRLREQASSTNARRIAVHWGADSPPLPDQPGITLTGALPVLDIADFDGPAGNGLTPDALAGLPPLQRVDLRAEGLDVGRWRLGAIHLEGSPSGLSEPLSVSGSAVGELQWQPDNRHLAVDLERLDASVRAERGQRTTAEQDRASLLARGNSLDVSARALVLAGQPMGALEFRVEGGGEQLRRARLALAGEVGEVEAALQQVAPGTDRYRLRFDVHADDAGSLLTGIGLDDAMRSGQGYFGGELSWQGALLQPDRSTLEGRLSVNLRNGSLPAVEPGAGRALGLFSLSVLPRRLALDFSDVVGAGLRFDSLRGAWVGNQGRLFTEDLALKGPSLNMALVGTTDLATETYDQTVTVTPRVGSAVGFLGGVAGGPVAAIMLFLTRDLLEPEIDRASEVRYRIQGPWADPRFELIGTGVRRNGANRDD